MSNVISFKPKDQCEFEEKLALVKQMFECCRQQRASVKCNWVFLTRDNFMKITAGTHDAPMFYRIPKRQKLLYSIADINDSQAQRIECYEFQLAKELDNGDLLYVERD